MKMQWIINESFANVLFTKDQIMKDELPGSQIICLDLELSLT